MRFFWYLLAFSFPLSTYNFFSHSSGSLGQHFFGSSLEQSGRYFNVIFFLDTKMCTFHLNHSVQVLKSCCGCSFTIRGWVLFFRSAVCLALVFGMVVESAFTSGACAFSFRFMSFASTLVFSIVDAFHFTICYECVRFTSALQS